jgi:hypothetical protein
MPTIHFRVPPLAASLVIAPVACAIMGVAIATIIQQSTAAEQQER